MVRPASILDSWRPRQSRENLCGVLRTLAHRSLCSVRKFGESRTSETPPIRFGLDRTFLPMSRLRAKSRARAQPSAEVVEAFRLQSAGHAAEAERLYRRALDREPGEFLALHQLGLLLRERGDTAQALEFIAASLRADRGSAAARANHGLVLHDLGRYAEAIDSFNRAIVIDRHHVAAIYNRG